jgi:hypothetical protein
VTTQSLTQPNRPNPWSRRLRLLLPITAGVLILGVFGLTIYEIWFMNFGPDAAAYSYVVADPGNMPPEDARGAFLQLNAATNKRYPSNLIGLTETEEPGVISTTQAIHILPSEMDAVIVRQAAIADGSEYRVYPLAADSYPMTADTLSNGVMIRIYPTAGHWRPGFYMVDIPANGTFGGREYYSFVVDEETK